MEKFIKRAVVGVLAAAMVFTTFTVSPQAKTNIKSTVKASTISFADKFTSKNKNKLTIK